LSVVGERENAELHVIFFSSFLISTFINFTTHFYLEAAIDESSGNGKRTRMVLLAFLWLLIPYIITAFALHELYCAKYSYELFAIGEYLTIATIFAFNSTIFMDAHQNCVYLTFIPPKRKKRLIL
jgi:hypothetical protein